MTQVNDDAEVVDPPPEEAAPAPAPVIFLDTNCVHYARIALAFIRQHGLDLLNMTVDNLRTAIEQQIGKSALEHYVKGYWLLRYLRQRNDGGAVVMYSPATRLELVAGGLRGCAVLRAAAAKAPQRWYGRTDEKELFYHLVDADYQSVQIDTDGLQSLFEERAGIEIFEADAGHMVDVFALSNVILSVSFLEMGDCMVFANALLERASELITGDSYLNYIVANTRSPGSLPPANAEQFRGIQQRIVTELAGFLGVAAPEVLIPESVPTKIVHQRAVQGGAA